MDWLEVEIAPAEDVVVAEPTNHPDKKNRK